MNKLNSTAKKLDTFFKVFNTLLSIAGVTLLVGILIVAAAFLFNLPPEMVGTGYTSLTFGPLELSLAEGVAPDARAVLAVIGVECALAIVVCLITRLCVKCVRQILAPMIENQPFNCSVSLNLKKLAKYTLFLGIAVLAIQWISDGLMIFLADLPNLLISEKVTHVGFQFDADLSFLIVSAVFLLLSYVFEYGEQLQQLSDETL